MSADQAIIKILENEGNDLNHFLSAFPTHLLLRTVMVKGTSGGADGRVEYIGYALPSTTKAQARWLIKKLVYDATGFQIDSLFADGESKFDKVMNDYSTYSYSAT